MKYEYTSVESTDHRSFAGSLTEKAAEGWRLVKVVYDADAKSRAAWVGIMEREIKAQ